MSNLTPMQTTLLLALLDAHLTNLEAAVTALREIPALAQVQEEGQTALERDLQLARTTRTALTSPYDTNLCLQVAP